MSALFTPVRVGVLELANRVVIAPMCQYSAVNGCMTDWHLIHLGHLALSGAALLTIEATAVLPEERRAILVVHRQELAVERIDHGGVDFRLASQRSCAPAPSGPKSRLRRFCANWRCSAFPTSARSCAGGPRSSTQRSRARTTPTNRRARGFRAACWCSTAGRCRPRCASRPAGAN